ncbi:MAG: hypothetical protein JKX82_00795 [Oleispira sp.]|nr:hypothetical protein [Oleispira sp.]
MGRRKQIGKTILALVLLSALMLPAVIQFSHAVFQEHEHIACNEQTIHIHADIDDCQICHFQLASFNYEVRKYTELLIAPIPVEVESQYSSLLFYVFRTPNTQLRGPPHFLS